MGTLTLTARRCAQCVKLGGKLGLRLDERPTVVAHWLVAGIGVLGEERESGRDKQHEKEDESKGGVDDEENDTHDTSDDGLAMLAQVQQRTGA